MERIVRIQQGNINNPLNTGIFAQSSNIYNTTHSIPFPFQLYKCIFYFHNVKKHTHEVYIVSPVPAAAIPIPTLVAGFTILLAAATLHVSIKTHTKSPINAPAFVQIRVDAASDVVCYQVIQVTF